MIKVTAIPALKDNYIWCLSNEVTRTCAIVDPGDAVPVLDFLQQQQLTLEAILITHHHQDHVYGVAQLLDHYQVAVYGSQNSPFKLINHPLSHLQTITLLETLKLQVLAVPGHTLDHIVYYGDEKLFCGDTLFAAGCGRLFEGTAEQLYESLQKLAQLPDATAVYCGHEYTLANLNFAQQVEPDNKAIAERIIQVKKLRESQASSLPSNLAVEKLTNPFLRVNQPAVIQAVSHHAQQKLTDQIEVFKCLRLWKDSF